jgi:glycosyltransferase involved in cell wall biosynthesis
LRFAFLSFRPFTIDFRHYLMQALQSLGHPCVHVFLGRGAMEFRSGRNLDVVTPLASLADAARHVGQFFGPNRGIVVNSAGNSAPDVVLRLWMKLRECVWIYDVYDWMLYDATGLKWAQWWLTDRAYRSVACCCCLRSRELQAHYPRSFFSDNASHLVPARGPKVFDNKIVVTASFDRRTNFELLRSVAEKAPDIVLDLYGSIYDNDQATVDTINQLTTDRKNVRYHGRFEFDQLQTILDGYLIGLAPYRVEDRMTRFISPDKLFHYLCAGLEVIASPIPGIRPYGRYVREASDADTAVAAIRQIAKSGERRNPGDLYERFNWQIRAREFCDSVEPYLHEGARPVMSREQLS